MDTDMAFSNFENILQEIESLESIETEADTRFQIIDRFMTEVLQWDRDSIILEPYMDSGYADYLLKEKGSNKLVIEAKRANSALIDTKSKQMRAYKVSGPSLKSCLAALKQAQKYCIKTGVTFSCITNGFQWVAFWAVRDDGLPPFDGKAIVFPTLESIKKSFAVFYDLFSREGIAQQVYKAHITEKEGFKVVASEKLEAALQPEKIFLLKKSSLAADIDVVFQKFFSDISRQDDPDMLAKCFVESKESKESEIGLEKIARHLIGEIGTISSGAASELHDQIKQAIVREKGNFVLIIGNKGAGKSTFIDRFFRLVIDTSLKSQCLILRIDLADSGGDTSSIPKWLTSQLLIKAESAMYKNIHPSYDELQGVFMSDYDRWRNAEYSHLYKSDKEAFKIKFGDYLHNLKEYDTNNYVIKLLQSAVKSRKLLPCIIFDNTDHYPQEFQEAVFLFAQSINRAMLSFVICPITDRTVWQLSKSGPLQSYDCHSFYLPTPQTKEILHKRVSYLKLKVDEESKKEKKSYTLNRGLKLQISDIKNFAACIDEVFVKSDFVSRTVGWLSNHDIRRSLKIAQRIITSPLIPIVDLIKTWVNGDRLPIPEMKIRQALLYGSYNMFHQEHSDYILNLFLIEPRHIATPLTKLSILRLLMDTQNSASNGEQEYLEFSKIYTYFDVCGLNKNTLRLHIEDLLKYRLVEPYNPTDDSIYDKQRIRITHCGKIHYEFAVKGYIYVQNMALVTPLRDYDVVVEIRSLIGTRNKMDREGWDKLKSIFISYVINEDNRYFTVPQTDQYQGQKNLRNEMKSSWVNDQ